jgi:hypothetical protein
MLRRETPVRFATNVGSGNPLRSGAIQVEADMRVFALSR